MAFAGWCKGGQGQKQLSITIYLLFDIVGVGTAVLNVHARIQHEQSVFQPSAEKWLRDTTPNWTCLIMVTMFWLFCKMHNPEPIQQCRYYAKMEEGWSLGITKIHRFLVESRKQGSNLRARWQCTDSTVTLTSSGENYGFNTDYLIHRFTVYSLIIRTTCALMQLLKQLILWQQCDT